jgi:hypothetical protein
MAVHQFQQFMLVTPPIAGKSRLHVRDHIAMTTVVNAGVIRLRSQSTRAVIHLTTAAAFTALHLLELPGQSSKDWVSPPVGHAPAIPIAIQIVLPILVMEPMAVLVAQ